MVYEVMAASGVLFWCLIFAAIILIAWPLGDDAPAPAVLLFVAAIAGLILFTDIAGRVSLWAILLLAPLYVAIGIGWALYKWRAFVLETKRKAASAWDNKKPNDYPGVTREKYMEGERPTAAANKDKITGWMALWPWSMAWVVLRFPWRLIVWTYERISTVFERWSAKLWAE